MFGMLSKPYMDCSPDGVSLLDISKFSSPETFSNCHKLEHEASNYSLATVEVKKAVSASSILAYLSLSTDDFIICSVGSEEFRT